MENLKGKKFNRLFEVNGITHTIQEWSKITGIGYTTLRYRMLQGKTGEDLIKSPKNKELK